MHCALIAASAKKTATKKSRDRERGRERERESKVKGRLERRLTFLRAIPKVNI